MFNEYNILNDNELIFLFKEGNSIVIQNIFIKYKKIIKSIIEKIINKFYNIPFEYSDFQSYIYFWISNALNKYNEKHKKSFKSYLIMSIKWNCLNFISNFINKNNKLLNKISYNDLDDYENTKSIFINDKNILYNAEINKIDYNKNFLYYILNDLKLSNLEKEIFVYKCKGKTNSEILKITNYPYKKIDNAYTRIKSKIKSLNGVDLYH